IPFAVHLLQRLRERDPEQTPALVWLTKQIEDQGSTPDDVVRREHHEQVATHVTVRNVITSMRLISSVDWTELFESVSLVEEALRSGTRVSEMDFPTRDRYRHAVEDLSRRSPVSEIEVARRAAERARRAKESNGDDPAEERKADPGYYLISRGRHSFEKELGYRVPLTQWVRRAYCAAATPGYVGTILVATATLLALPLALTAAAGASAWEIAVLALLALIPASDVAVAIVNRDVTELVGPRRLPKLEFAKGIPEELDTLVVVPALLTSKSEVRELAERLEVHYLSNSDRGLRFALLSDWADSAEESTPEDEPLYVAASEAIGELNDRHGRLSDGARRFLFLHRRRLWNVRESKWIGWERKRGKLHELDRLLRGGEPTTFFPVDASDRAALGRVRYVLTLDADTRLPRGAVRKLVGAIAHPLNRPLFDPRDGRVVDGYAVLQPRIMPTLPLSGHSTLYQRIHSGPAGIDPYAAAVSDVYQDLFAEGIYTGKGIYDVDAFEKALGGRIPEDTLLSHDLFEGLFARAGLATDVELFEQFPAHYEVAATRQHRWARGDWQLLPWLAPWVPHGSRRFVRNPIPAIGRWKILDNLRRTLTAPSAFLALVLGWTLPGVPAGVWTAAVLAAFAMPGLFSILAGLVPGRRGISKRSYLRGVGRDFALSFGQAAFVVVLLAHQAWLMGDAILRTLFRLLVSRRRLLEWVPAAQAAAGLDFELSGFYRRMRGAVALALLAGAAVLVADGALPLALPFVLLWILSPWIAWKASLPPRESDVEALSEEDRKVLQSTARRTFRFFEAFVGPDDNYLPPDNFQEDPRPVVAHRTSPTNIGLYLLSTVAARDFAWIGTVEMVDRLEATFAAVARLELYRGHLYNWYETKRLEPLEPRYVSTVDSGNLAGHLIALERACLERLEAPALDPRA
ncbi:MAG: glycosyl transferase, partial [Acidobacteriota bacterium]|nr:glycosyl transferase [Acidobacteriota bacterium]